MRILSLDSATESASCSIVEDTKTLGEITFNYKKQHSVILMNMIDSLLKNLNLTIDSIDGFVVSKGPGSFTGLRIGSATIKGLSQGTSKPFVGISSLDALAYNMAYTPGIVCPILDALRNNVYTALYTFTGEKLEKITDYMIISVDELISILSEKNEPVCFIGDATFKFKDKLKNSLIETTFAPTHLNLVRSSSLGEIGLELLKEGSKDDLLTFAPIYLRKSQAEREYEKKHGADINE
ncbi:tRNA threonylcarbamoyl adenosine modification protein YeaZ [Clostridium tetanomorphum]|uniref:tRNA (Adenosine(37)-N6)-threonylcarbamoyltransferase complex dimerization subunit type 1 TsaB n=1 Tax=Clostridium tetanomorphum TaxID=1553 RepID=A0A923EBL8_CLOTT|nr:tRNA (adenosine(37)-N6)-threonylcarbamoyltransferase complex dimerization subunit type 1 TsaB [Clostridium tetanomorphum]KAJ48830.1 glycoprotease family protein [Clostridium tetanomorphum DSM 665]KAJ53339.1 glycoprotease family protein [Clostridium tetanomorphum DSM 665]MBC2400108.1 tRNA (adenosine(37)-N6)-threonylcarbamoyltransferase complex dimerization subunit type 1 TsaB [Clostridium tetanomorphum]MBP1866290.1 tRNA threonylcarbamoyl adenosine modification protein YeaZ [Clostridium tetano